MIKNKIHFHLNLHLYKLSMDFSLKMGRNFGFLSARKWDIYNCDWSWPPTKIFRRECFLNACPPAIHTLLCAKSVTLPMFRLECNKCCFYRSTRKPFKHPHCGQEPSLAECPSNLKFSASWYVHRVPITLSSGGLPCLTFSLDVYFDDWESQNFLSI